MIRHLLLMKFNDNTPRYLLTEIQNEFESVNWKIPGVLSVEWGENNIPAEENAEFTHCVMITFMDESTRREYHAYKKHLMLTQSVRPYLEGAIVFDYQFGCL